jgi:hypothetical protein
MTSEGAHNRPTTAADEPAKKDLINGDAGEDHLPRHQLRPMELNRKAEVAEMRQIWPRRPGALLQTSTRPKTSNTGRQSTPTMYRAPAPFLCQLRPAAPPGRARDWPGHSEATLKKLTVDERKKGEKHDELVEEAKSSG